MIKTCLSALWCIFFSCSVCAQENTTTLADVHNSLLPVKHIIVIFLENHSFDNLFATFPGARGLSEAPSYKTIQKDREGKPYTALPAVMNGKEIDKRFPTNLPNQPFLITKYVPYDEKTGDLVHRFYQLQMQMNEGLMDQYSAVSNAGGLTQGYYAEKDSPLWQYAQKYTLADNFFTGVFGGSFVNHIFLICACIPRYDHAPEDLLSLIEDREFSTWAPPVKGKLSKLYKDAPLTLDGYAVNTIEPFNPPYNKKAVDATKRLPVQKMPTIGERLSEKNIDWAWYTGGWNEANAGNAAEDFVFHHQPFLYFGNYAPATPGRKAHLKDETDLLEAIENNHLPSVVFYKPQGEFDLHPGYSTLKASQDHVFDMVKKIEKSEAWKDSVIIITFDDAGGWFDHVMPPKIDRFGPGARVPLLVVSPFAKQGFIDHTFYDTASILKLIEIKFDLQPLGKRDADAGDLRNALKQ